MPEIKIKVSDLSSGIGPSCVSKQQSSVFRELSCVILFPASLEGLGAFLTGLLLLGFGFTAEAAPAAAGKGSSEASGIGPASVADLSAWEYSELVITGPKQYQNSYKQHHHSGLARIQSRHMLMCDSLHVLFIVLVLQTVKDAEQFEVLQHM